MAGRLAGLAGDDRLTTWGKDRHSFVNEIAALDEKFHWGCLIITLSGAGGPRPAQVCSQPCGAWNGIRLGLCMEIGVNKLIRRRERLVHLDAPGALVGASFISHSIAAPSGHLVLFMLYKTAKVHVFSRPKSEQMTATYLPTDR